MSLGFSLCEIQASVSLLHLSPLRLPSSRNFFQLRHDFGSSMFEFNLKFCLLNNSKTESLWTYLRFLWLDKAYSWRNPEVRFAFPQRIFAPVCGGFLPVDLKVALGASKQYALLFQQALYVSGDHQIQDSLKSLELALSWEFLPTWNRAMSS